VLVATFTDADPASMVGPPTSDYTATINWGDGTSSAAPRITAAGSPSGVVFSVYGNHSYGAGAGDEGSVAISVIIKDAGGSQTIASSEADIADAPLASTPAQPPVAAAEGVALPPATAIATFTDANPLATPADFTATIDWGDGTPQSAGTVSGPVAGVFTVTGGHTYADSGVNGGTGTFKITVHVADDGGSVVNLTNTANVTDVAIALTGKLNPASDSGKLHNDGVTNVNQPNFFGHSEAFSHVVLFATPTAGGGTTEIGQTQAGGDGSWNITSDRLADGSYTISATAVDQSGHTTTTAPVTIAAPLVIDTVGPRVIDVNFQRLTGQVFITFQDDRSGMLIQSLVDAANFTFNKQHHRPPGKYIVTGLSVSGGQSPTDLQTVDVTINGGKRIRGGFYTITAHAASVLKTAGIQDLAGNGLDGEFYGPRSASGNGVPGGDFVANINAFHNLILAPKTVVGTPHPNDPPARFAKATRRHAHGAAIVVSHHAAALKAPATVHDAAMHALSSHESLKSRSAH